VSQAPAAIVIPARLESSRLPRKLLRADTGIPLLCHTLEAAAQAASRTGGRIADIVAAVDHPDLFAAVEAHRRSRGLPVRAEMTRADHPSGSDRMAEVASRLPAEIDVLVNLQGDEPEMDPDAVVRLLSLLDEAEADLATLAWPIRDAADFANPNLVKVVLGAAGEALYFSRSPIPFDRDGAGATPHLGLGHLGLYAYRRSALARFVALPPGRLERLEKLEQLRALENGMRIRVGVLPGRPPKGVDTEEDYREFVRRQA